MTELQRETVLEVQIVTVLLVGDAASWGNQQRIESSCCLESKGGWTERLFSFDHWFDDFLCIISPTLKQIMINSTLDKHYQFLKLLLWLPPYQCWNLSFQGVSIIGFTGVAVLPSNLHINDLNMIATFDFLIFKPVSSAESPIWFRSKYLVNLPCWVTY